MATRPKRVRSLGRSAIVVLALGFLLIQLVPYGRDHVNPATRVEPAWNSTATRELAVLACFDCHSNQTVWPWYSNIAPASWLIQWDVDRGRRKLNFSEWDRPQDDADEAAEVVESGEMPPRTYLLPHPEARLSPEEVDLLVAGLGATFGDERSREGGQNRRGRGGDDD